MDGGQETTRDIRVIRLIGSQPMPPKENPPEVPEPVTLLPIDVAKKIRGNRQWAGADDLRSPATPFSGASRNKPNPPPLPVLASASPRTPANVESMTPKKDNPPNRDDHHQSAGDSDPLASANANKRAGKDTPSKKGDDQPAGSTERSVATSDSSKKRTGSAQKRDQTKTANRSSSMKKGARDVDAKTAHQEETIAHMQASQVELLVQVAHISRQAQDANAAYNEQRQKNEQLKTRIIELETSLQKQEESSTNRSAKKSDANNQQRTPKQAAENRDSERRKGAAEALDKRQQSEISQLQQELKETKERLEQLQIDHRQALELIVTMGTAFANPKASSTASDDAVQEGPERPQQVSQAQGSESSVTPNRKSSAPERPPFVSAIWPLGGTSDFNAKLLGLSTPEKSHKDRMPSLKPSPFAAGSSNVPSKSPYSGQKRASGGKGDRDRMDEYYRSILPADATASSALQYEQQLRESIEKSRADLTSHLKKLNS